jgi:hypothetical protein
LSDLLDVCKKIGRHPARRGSTSCCHHPSRDPTHDIRLDGSRWGCPSRDAMYPRVVDGAAIIGR